MKELSHANLSLGHYKEGIDQVRGALEICERLGGKVERAGFLDNLAALLKEDGQLDAGEEAVVESIKLLQEKGQEQQLYSSHTTLGQIYQVKGKREKAIYHYELALGIASTFHWRPYLSQIHALLAQLFLDEGRFEDADVRIKQAKSQALGNAHSLGSVVLLQALIWYGQRRFEDAAPEALHAQDIFGRLGNARCLEASRNILRGMEEAMRSPPPSGKSDTNGELPEAIASPVPVNPSFSAHGASSSALASTYSP